MRRTRLLYFILLLASFTACGPKVEQTPEGILTKETMVAVLTDIQLAEAAISIKNLAGDSARYYAAACFNFIYKQHKIPKKVFETSLEYYTQHPKDLDLIYTEVISNLSEKEAKEVK